jgi:plasmid stability protein
MAKMIQLRNVPEELYRTLEARAAMAGMSLSDYLLREISKAAAHPSQEELLERLRSRSAPSLDVAPSAAVRAERDRR